MSGRIETDGAWVGFKEMSWCTVMKRQKKLPSAKLAKEKAD
jgi:hypothetical protein